MPECNCLYEVYLVSEACNAFINYIVKILQRRTPGFIYSTFKNHSLCRKIRSGLNDKIEEIALRLAGNHWFLYSVLFIIRLR